MRKKVSEYEKNLDYLDEFSLEKFLLGRYSVKVSLIFVLEKHPSK